METPVSWYREWFDRAEYSLVYQRRDDREAAEVIDLIDAQLSPPRGAFVLDVGCGRGRHALEFARRGYAVAGIDLSASAIEEARNRAAEQGLDVRFERQDMREPFCTGCADVVVNLFTAFGYFDDDSGHQRAIRAMCTALRPGGWLVQDFLNAPHVIASFVPEDGFDVEGRRVRQRRWVENGRINKEITITADGVTQRFTESVRLLTLDDFRDLYARCGLTIRHVFGSYDGRPHDDDAPRLIIMAQKP